MDSLINDLRFAARTLRRSPLFTIIAVATLALGIGANAALFSVVNGVILRPLPLADPSRLVVVGMDNLKLNWRGVGVTGADFAAWQRANKTFAGLSAMTGRNAELTGKGDPTEVYAVAVSNQFFSVVPARPIVGRTFVESEFLSKDGEVAVLSESLWRTRFGGDPGVVGQKVMINGMPRTIIGVVPGTTQWPRDAEIYFALPPLFEQMGPGNHLLQVIGRLRAGVTREQATADLNVLSAPIESLRPEGGRGWSVATISADDFVVGGNSRRGLYLLLAAVAFVLLLVCANVAGLQLSRATARAQELAVRRALGGTRARIVRQLLIESALLAVTGGAAGFVLAQWGVDLLRGLGPDAIPRLDEVRVDTVSLLFTAGVSLTAAVLCGFAPALLGSRTEVSRVLKESGRSVGGGRGPLVRAGLVVAEVAVALILLVGAGLMVKSFGNLRAIPLGYDPHNVLDVDLDIPAARYAAPESRSRFVQQVEARLRALPGVVTVGSTRALPLESGGPDVQFSIAGRAAPPPGESGPGGFFTAVTPDYFRTMRMRVVRGRGFLPSDDVPTARLVVVINETMAKRYWPSENPVGQHITLGTDRAADVIGVVNDVRQRFLTSDVAPAMFVPFSQAPEVQISTVLRSSVPPATLVAAIHREVWAVDPNLPVEQWTMEELMGFAVATPRFQTFLLSGFAFVALLVAVIGVYAVVSYAVSMRTREIGVRMALGAERRDVIQLVLGQGARLAVIGSVLGLAAAFALTRFMRGVLYHVATTDAVTMVFAAISLTLVAVVATYLPARRAARVDPTVALRQS